MSMRFKPRTMKIVGVGMENIAPFYHLLGIDEVYVVKEAEKDKLHNIINRLRMREDVAVIIIQNRLYNIIKDLVSYQNRLYPIFVSIPDYLDLEKFDIYEFYKPIIRKYIGFEVTLT